MKWLDDGHEFEQVPRVGDGQGSLACCSPLGHKESDRTEQLNCYFYTLLVLSFILKSGNMSPLTLLFFFFQNCFGYSSSLIFSIHTLDSICLYIERVLLRLNL